MGNFLAAEPYVNDRRLRSRQKKSKKKNPSKGKKKSSRSKK